MDKRLKTKYKIGDEVWFWKYPEEKLQNGNTITHTSKKAIFCKKIENIWIDIRIKENTKIDTYWFTLNLGTTPVSEYNMAKTKEELLNSISYKK